MSESRPRLIQTKKRSLAWGACIALHLILQAFCLSSAVLARELVDREGAWVPELGELGERALSSLEIGGGGRGLYAMGSGRIWRLPKASNQEDTTTQGVRWEKLGRYAPRIQWDEGEGFSASGPFSQRLLSEVETQLGEAMEAMLEDQGDEDWLSEDAVSTLIEAYEEEVQPAIDSPFRVNGTYPQREGLWLATGSGVWATTDQGLVPLPESPIAAISVIQQGTELWSSSLNGVFRTEGYLEELQLASREQRQAVPRWKKLIDTYKGRLLHHKGRLLAWSGTDLFYLSSEGEVENALIPIDTKAVASGNSSTQGGGEERLWALTSEALWFSRSPLPLAWERCQALSKPLAQLRATPLGVLLITPSNLTLISHDCNQRFDFELPSTETVQFTDALWWEGKLYATTTGGLFTWESGDKLRARGVGLRYLQRDLALFPPFFKVYRAALLEQELSPQQSGYGMRPVVSALLPQMRFRYITNPSRLDQQPAFNSSGRQLTLLQPTPELELFFEWRISLDFLTTLIDPERTSAYSEAQSQIDRLVDDPLAGLELESEVGLMEDWTEETFTSQAQRLALTTVALERRQQHRDRQALRIRLMRLYRERLKMTYTRWLSGESEGSLDPITALRLQELDAYLDAATGYRLQIQDTMQSTPSLIKQ